MQASKKIFYTDVVSRVDNVYKIPVYQRNYSWTTKECDILIRDIEKIYNGLTTKHFIGTLVIKTEDGKNNHHNIIDGQQRFTTLTLLLKAIADISENESLKERINDALINKYATIEDKIKLIPNPKDKIVYDQIMCNLNISDEVSRIYLNYKHFKNKLVGYDLDKFFDAIKQLEIVEIQLQYEDDPQVIFESINSTGVNLNVSDLIRNFLLMSKDYEVQTSLFQNYWKVFEEKLGTEQLIVFFEIFLFAKTGNGNISKNQMYDVFKEYYFSNAWGENDIELFTLIDKYVNHYLILTGEIEVEDKKLAEQLKHYQTINVVQTSILMIELLEWRNNGFITTEDLVYAFKFINSYNFRRQIVGKSMGIARKLAILPKEIQYEIDKGCSFIEAVNYALCYNVRSSSYSFISDNEIINTLISKDLYLKFQNTKYLLINLNHALNKAKFIPDADEITIEHIMPQTLSNEWISALGDDVNKHEEFVHDLGNLTLTSINVELSNRSFNEKKEYLKEEMLFKINNTIIDKNCWGIKEIEERSRELALLTTKIWFYPEFDKVKYEQINTTHKINNYKTYQIEELLDHATGIKLNAIMLNNEFIEADSNKGLLEKLIQYMLLNHKEEFYDKVVLSDENIKSNGRYWIHENDEFVTWPMSIENLYFTGGNSDVIIKQINMICSNLLVNIILYSN